MNSLSANIPTISPERLEEYSSAATLSDMEIFIFPNLFYSLVLANLMSPRIWRWRDDPWFTNFSKLTPYRRILRLRQFIMDNYVFNLDLETWGLTTQERELERFAPYMDRATIAQSNALFGYEGDRFYFDIDIRRHFGLDKFTSNVIPYWKTETVEAMDAFRFYPGYTHGAGECVSLSTLYAAALYILCEIPLEDIYLVATPLHSQNFVDMDEGILTNNRRLVTKSMWFNGTELSTKARRALENEQVTIVAHSTGWIHAVYPTATIAPAAYDHVKSRLGDYLQTQVSAEIIFNFLRQNPERQRCFQIEFAISGKPRWIPAERAYAFENSCPYKVSDRTREKLLAEMDEDEFFPTPLPDRIPLNKFDDAFRHHQVDLNNEEDRQKLGREFDCYQVETCDILRELQAFCILNPRWPDHAGPKQHTPMPPINLPVGLSREDIIRALEQQRAANPIADLAFYTARDMARMDPRPFFKAAIERSPVCIDESRAMDLTEIVAHLQQLPNESTYDLMRVAQPDEVWHSGRGDGFEKAVTLATILHAREPDTPFAVQAEGDTATLSFGGTDYAFPTTKGLSLKLEWPLA